MESVIERNAMVNSINETGNFKRVDTESRVQRLQNQKEGESVSTEASSVNLSDASQQLATLKDIILKEPDVDNARVEYLKELLHSGRYEISSSKIAKKMFDDIQLA
ncbi:flagellar biosynthesis anti-sigma factor FlgM [Legionella sp. MW5194]|uniref:flagellar biosynthesis anti-sigma factor FlgM n=1 Tax=Legionella sp. MW5194 TaxID=2662448 RepID=UPI00193DBA5F|nr:flagellar biosynthesis anti-sigma factor FlgM [Legionella sp. MW5194]QRN03652.1 flagellar biosynthesis anti-sigma factor FlgM [Legionella sp. MW5194]